MNINFDQFQNLAEISKRNEEMLQSLAEMINELPLASQQSIIAMANHLRNLKAQPNIEIENPIIYPQTPNSCKREQNREEEVH